MNILQCPHCERAMADALINQETGHYFSAMLSERLPTVPLQKVIF